MLKKPNGVSGCDNRGLCGGAAKPGCWAWARLAVGAFICGFLFFVFFRLAPKGELELRPRSSPQRAKKGGQVYFVFFLFSLKNRGSCGKKAELRGDSAVHHDQEKTKVSPN